MAQADFLEYFKREFFAQDSAGFEQFRASLFRPLKKTIRLNTNQIDIREFIDRKSSEGWTFTPTPNGHVFYVDRLDTSSALWSSAEHMRGDFYIQELSASMAVWILSGGQIHPETVRILEMASSPWGKTTQLAEHYPNSFIVANEFTKDRINALIDNIERMRVSSIGISNLNGVQFRDYPNLFDVVLLDAPCSGEGIGFKAEQSLKYWNIKNVQKIARLQSKLLISGITALKPGGTLLYSTCTLNKIENEGVLESAVAVFWESIEIEMNRRFWPHTEVAGGFFVAKIRKIAELKNEWDQEEKTPKLLRWNADIVTLSKREIESVRSALTERWATIPETAQFYRYKQEVRMIAFSQGIDDIVKTLYMIRLWVPVGRFEGGKFVSSPTYSLPRSPVGSFRRDTA